MEEAWKCNLPEEPYNQSEYHDTNGDKAISTDNAKQGVDHLNTESTRTGNRAVVACRQHH